MDFNKKLFEEGSSVEISNYAEKLAAAKKIAAKAKDGDVIGFGSGSTCFLAVQEFGKRVLGGLKILAVPTSFEIKMLCVSENIPVADINSVRPDWCFDGADEIDPNGWLIKGRGGAMFCEKLVMENSKKRFIIADSSKFVKKLGTNFPVPVECVKQSLMSVKEKLHALGAIEAVLRLAGKSKDGPVITENGNFIVDARFGEIDETLEKKIKSITGVVESGLFIGYDVEIIKI